METKIFLNLAVKDLNKSIAFFTQLGFSFNSKFTNEQGTCLVIGKNINAMLLTKEFYQTFTNKQICNTATTNEVIISISVEGRDKVDEMMDKVIKAGGSEYMKTQDYDWMYNRTFLDLDGHQWEVFYMNESKIPEMK
ncbi:VOC family protein [Flavobacterium sp.]|uniref:VOC family protein n=1 Tax=Flavobacterium sp. TaxID=239 RepID=UPI003D0A9AC3